MKTGRLYALRSFLIGFLLLGAHPLAQANGRFPTANQLVLAPSDPELFVLRTTFGILISRDHGENWDWVCEKAVGYGGSVEDPPLGVTASSAIIAGLFEGLSVSSATGCSWNLIGGALGGRVIADVTVRRDTPESALALAYSLAVGDGGASVYSSQLYATNDNGAHWAAFGTPLDGTVIPETVDIAPSDAHRIYVSGRVSGASPKGVFLVSDNDGTTWTQHDLPLVAPGTQTAFIAGVDPSNADWVYVRTGGSTSSELLLTTDAGAHFQTVLSASGQLTGFALSPDGSKIYVGGPRDGLEIAERGDLVFHKQSDLPVECLVATQTTLFACLDTLSILSASADDGLTMTPLLRLDGVRGPLGCPTGSSASTCINDWPALEAQLGIAPNDAGADSSSPDAATPSTLSVGGGCTVSSKCTARGVCGWFGLLVAVGLCRQRRGARARGCQPGRTFGGRH